MKVLVIGGCGTSAAPETVKALREQLMEKLGPSTTIDLELYDRVHLISFPQSTYDLILSGSIPPAAVAHSDSLLGRLASALKPGGELRLCEPILKDSALAYTNKAGLTPASFLNRLPCRTVRTLVASLRLGGFIVDVSELPATLFTTSTSTTQTHSSTLSSIDPPSSSASITGISDTHQTPLHDQSASIELGNQISSEQLVEWAKSIYGIGILGKTSDEQNAERESLVERWKGVIVLASVVAKKPKYETGAAVRLNFKRNTKRTDTIAAAGATSSSSEKRTHTSLGHTEGIQKSAQIWTISATDEDDADWDLEDEAGLLDEEDQLALKGIKHQPSCPNNSMEPERAVKKKKACDTCQCGLAERIEQQLTESEMAIEKDLAALKSRTGVPQNSCASCGLADAFRCSSCPYTPLPKFNVGQRVVVDVEK